MNVRLWTGKVHVRREMTLAPYVTLCGTNYGWHMSSKFQGISETEDPVDCLTCQKILAMSPGYNGMGT